MVETRPCSKCGGLCFHNEGISAKTGKPYENWKCKACGDIEWIPVAPKTDDKLGAIREMLIVIDEKINRLLNEKE
jgi:hypothetical protein